MRKILPLSLFIAIIYLAGLLKPTTVYGQVETGRSYVNITKGTTGGTFEPGDILEIRAAVAVGNSTTITSVRYNDTIDNNFTYIPASLKILTNEGLVFRAYSDAASDDPAMFSNTNNSLRINLGATATSAVNTGNTAASGGTIAFNNKPSFYGGVCIMVASFRVKINAALAFNTMITLPGGAFRYTNASGTTVVVNFTPNKIMLVKNLPSCSNYIGSNAVIENNGSFGSGNTQNRNASAIIPGYTFVNFSSNQPNDGYYGIANNSSATGATNTTVAAVHASRVFSIWDIIGDHTGATNPLAGNAPAAPGTNGGYMAVVNASYATSPAIQQSVTNLCGNNYYDFSAWFRNICSLCACDSNGKGATNAAFNGPYKPGVKPNLTFQLDGIDYYTTGDMAYTGLWEKKGFTYLTGTAQTAFTLTIRNNSPGGGGNDWAMDDVTLSTCEPNIDLNITPVLLGCDGTQVNFSVTVKSYYPNYTFFKWQKSTDGGLTWIDTGISGTQTPTLVNGQYTYVATYPTFAAHYADSGSRYRVAAATSVANLASGACAYSNNKNTMLKIIDCSAILAVQLTGFSGRVINKKANLQWNTNTEQRMSYYELEKSVDGQSFVSAGTVKALGRNATSFYEFTDTVSLETPEYYRLKMVGKDGNFRYSNPILLNANSNVFSVGNITNPFQNNMDINYLLPKNGNVIIRLFNSYGSLVTQINEKRKKGLNTKKIEGLYKLAPGMYILNIELDNVSVSKKVVKL
jgi:hypothetical protein